jgi:deazaflavin-dependent oxidoreductase (nitroreductase family)
VHRVLFWLTRGTVGRRLVGNDVLLLTTVGRRSGHRHTVPLLYLTDGDRLVVIASYGGRDRHPDWYLNLAADPAVVAQVRGSRLVMRARTATPEERASWWPRVVAAYDGYRGYQSRTSRQIPVVILEPDVTSPSDLAPSLETDVDL